MFLIYLISLVNYNKERKLDQNKKPLVFTKKEVKRLVFTFLIITFLPFILSFIFKGKREILLIIHTLIIS